MAWGAALAALASGSVGPERLELLESFPGPAFVLGSRRSLADWLVTVRASPEVFPAEGDWTELFEVELDLEQPSPDGEPPFVFGRLARVAPGGRTVLSSTVAQVDVDPVATLRLTDEQGVSPCVDGVCQKQYVVRFVFVGRGRVETRWFVRAGVDWRGRDEALPPSATLTFEVLPLQ